MVTVKLAFVLVQVGSNLWVNPMLVEGIASVRANDSPKCITFIFTNDGSHCTDWTVEQVKEVLSTAAVSKAMEGK